MNPQSLAARWNATYPPGTPVTCFHLASEDGYRRPIFPAYTHGYAFIANRFEHSDLREGEAHTAVTNERLPSLCIGAECFPISCIEHRPILPPGAAASLAALGIPPASECGDPEPPLDLRAERLRNPALDLRDFAHRWLTIPEDVARWIEGLDYNPGQDELAAIEQRIATHHGLPAYFYDDGEAWLTGIADCGLQTAERKPPAAPRTRAEWTIHFTFAHRFITGTAELRPN